MCPRAANDNPTRLHAETSRRSQHPVWGETCPGDDGLDRALDLIDFTMYRLTILQVEDTDDPTEEIDASSRAIDQDKPGLR